MIVINNPGINAQESSNQVLTISSDPDSSPVKKGQEVKVKCTVEPGWTGGTVQWHQRLGSRDILLAENNFLSQSLVNHDRYSILSRSISSSSGQKVEYTLTIKGLVYEDSSKIGCAVRGSPQEFQFVSVAVCDDDLETEWCQCIYRKGWNDPDCLEKPGNLKNIEDNCKSTTIVLGVCFALALAYGIAASVVAGWDCMQRIRAKRDAKLKEDKARSEARRYRSDETRHLENDSNSSGQADNFSQQEPDPYTNLQRQAPYGSDPDPYTNLQVHAPYGGVSNGGFEMDRDGHSSRPKYPQSNGHIGGASQYDDGPPRYDGLQNGYREEYPSYPKQVDNDVRPRHPQTQNPTPNSRSYNHDRSTPSANPHQIPAATGPSPGSWSTNSEHLPHQNARYPQPDTRQAYSERPTRPRQFGRQNQAGPKRLDFSNPPSRYSNVEDLSGPYIDKSDTVV